MFSGSCYLMKLSAMLYDLTGSGKSKMAASKLEVPIFQPVDMIENTISKAMSIFLWSGFPIGQSGIMYYLTGSGNSKMAAFKPEACICIFLVNMIRTKFQRQYPCFRGQATRRE